MINDNFLKTIGLFGALASTGVFSYIFSLVVKILKLKVSQRQRNEVSDVVERIVLSVEQTYVKGVKKSNGGTKLTGKQSREAMRKAVLGTFNELAKMKNNSVAAELVRDAQALDTWIEQRVSWIFNK